MLGLRTEFTMNEPPAPLAAAEFKDRSTLLLVAGIVEILVGGVCALMVPLMLWSLAMSAQMGGGQLSYRMMVPGVVMYGLLAVTLVSLGIGSIMGRRWARALSLILSWSWLLMGGASLISMVFVLPKVLRGAGGGVPVLPVMLIAAGFLGVIFILLPGGLVLCYRSPQVKATCEVRDPTPRWTDACPLPVLAVSLWLGFGAVMLMLMPLAYNGVMPFFGVLLTGLPGALLCVGLAVLWAYLAWGFYHLRTAAWWITVAALLVFCLSSILTFMRVDLIEMYRLMGYPEQQIEQMKAFNFFTGKTVIWWMVPFFLPLFGYLGWVKKFFRGGA